MSKAYQLVGEGNFPCWEGYPEKRYRDDTDILTGTYITRRDFGLTKGQTVPGYPGMVIREMGVRDNGCWLRHDINAEGSLDGTLLGKVLSRSEVRTLGASFETFTEQRVSWITEALAITGNSSTDVITTVDADGNPIAHSYSDGQRVVLLDLTGGSGLTGQSASSLGTMYRVRDATTTTFKVETSVGAGAINFSTNITAGRVLAAEFCPGTPHERWPNMYLVGVSLSDNVTPWRKAECQYAGKMWTKGYHRSITARGQQFSSSDPITIDLPGGWPSVPEYSNFILPEIVVTDTIVTATAPATASIPGFSTPADPPGIQTLVITAASLTLNYPYGWTLGDSSIVESLHKDIALHIQQNVRSYVWPAMFR